MLEEDDLEPDAGLDLFYRISPNFKLSLSFNTDFAETEVDQRIVNLTRFPVFFPEKRDFFLEDSGPFVFGGGSNDIIPFFTRRVGIDDDGGEVPLVASAKLTGQTEDYTFGVLGVRTDEVGDLDEQNLFAARVSRNLFEQSDVGVIMTRGDPVDEGREATWGADLNLRTNEFLGDDNLRMSAFLLGTEGEGSDSDGLAYRMQLDYPNDQVQMRFTHEVVEDGFDPALGRIRRTGIKRYSGTVAYRPRLYSNIRQLDFRLRTDLFTDSRNDTKTVNVNFQPLQIEFESGDEVEVEVVHRREILDETFEISDDVEIEDGADTFTGYELGFRSAEKRPLVANLGFSSGEFFDGRRDDYNLGMDLRLSDRGELGLDYEINDVRLSDGDFRVHVARLRANLQFGPRLSWSNFVQWDNASDQMGLNSRLWWIPKPQAEFFLVFNQGWRVDADTFSPESSQVTFKVGYTLRF